MSQAVERSQFTTDVSFIGEMQTLGTADFQRLGLGFGEGQQQPPMALCCCGSGQC